MLSVAIVSRGDDLVKRMRYLLTQDKQLQQKALTR